VDLLTLVGPTMYAPKDGSSRRSPRSLSREPGNRCASVAAVAGVDADAHCRQHPLHTRANVVDGDRLHLVIAQETRDPRVVGALRSAVVQGTPADVELAPVADRPILDVGHRDPFSAAPARIDGAGAGDWYANLHAVHGRARYRCALAFAVAVKPGAHLEDCPAGVHDLLRGTHPHTNDRHDLALTV
jgi:hypothetical protein